MVETEVINSEVAASFAVVPVAMAQDPSGMGEKMARMGGSMTGVAKVCGDVSDQKLAESKQKQKAALERRGMETSGFDKAYDEGESEATQKFAALPEAERADACEQIKQQLGAAAQ